MGARTVTAILIRVTVNGRHRTIRADRSDAIRELLGEKTPTGEFLREMAAQTLDGQDTLDDGANWVLEEG